MSNNISEEQLLKMAMGVDTGDKEIDESAEHLRLKAEWEVIPTSGRQRIAKRRKMRNRIFRFIRALNHDLEVTPDMQAIRAIIEPQLDQAKQQNWYSFTFHWDIHPKDHTKIITKDRWFAEGGGYDELGQLKPAGFTEQQID